LRSTLIITLILSGITVSCSEGSFARYRLKSASLELIPSLSQAASYYSVSDTITLSELTQGSYYLETSLPSPIPSSEVDKVEVQQLDYYASSDPTAYLVEYHLRSIPEVGLATGSYDIIDISLISGNNVAVAELSLTYRDSLSCNSPECRYADTLTLDSVEYYEVYYLADNPQEPNLYINRSEGVVAFRDQQLKTYQRIK
jgi:hypothetical protein